MQTQGNGPDAVGQSLPDLPLQRTHGTVREGTPGKRQTIRHRSLRSSWTLGSIALRVAPGSSSSGFAFASVAGTTATAHRDNLMEASLTQRQWKDGRGSLWPLTATPTGIRRADPSSVMLEEVREPNLGGPRTTARVVDSPAACTVL